MPIIKWNCPKSPVFSRYLEIFPPLRSEVGKSQMAAVRFQSHDDEARNQMDPDGSSESPVSLQWVSSVSFFFQVYVRISGAPELEKDHDLMDLRQTWLDLGVAVCLGRKRRTKKTLITFHLVLMSFEVAWSAEYTECSLAINCYSCNQLGFGSSKLRAF